MSPKNGGKIELKLESSAPDGAAYEALLQTPAGAFRATAHVGANAGDKQVLFGAWSGAAGEPPEWLLADARAALKAALRTGRAEGRFPRRITRWRPEPAE